MRTMMLLAAIGTLACSIGCNSGDDDSTTMTTDCSNNAPQYVDVAMFDQCNKCHSSDLSGAARMEAPKEINFDSEADAKANAMKALYQVMHSYMPPPNSGITITSAEKNKFYHWAMCVGQ